MVTHEKELRFFVSDIGSTDRYIRFLNDVSNEARIAIKPASLRNGGDVKNLFGQSQTKILSKINQYLSCCYAQVRTDGSCFKAGLSHNG
jgi:hypothetical protein